MEQLSNRKLPFVLLPGWLVACTLLGILFFCFFGSVTRWHEAAGGATRARYEMEVAWGMFAMAARGFALGLLAQVIAGLRRFPMRWLIEVMVCVALLAYPIGQYVRASGDFDEARRQYELKVQGFL